jgi:alpha-L-fucosidase 2
MATSAARPAITEMLVQSTPDGIKVLPGLPQQWPSGSLKGVRVRGGGKVDIAWKEVRLTELKLQSDHAVKYHISYGAHSAEVQIQPGKPTLLDNFAGPRSEAVEKRLCE